MRCTNLALLLLSLSFVASLPIITDDKGDTSETFARAC